MVKPFTMDNTANSVKKTASHTDLNNGEEELVPVSLHFLEFQGLFSHGASVVLPQSYLSYVGNLQ